MTLRRCLSFCLCLLLLTSALCLFGGCKQSDPALVRSHEIDRATEKSMRYQTFSGEKVYDFSLSDQVKSILCRIETKGGVLELQILRIGDSAEEEALVIFRDSIEEEDLNKEILLTRGGNYRIQLTAKAHCGSYSFTWEEGQTK